MSVEQERTPQKNKKRVDINCWLQANLSAHTTCAKNTVIAGFGPAGGEDVTLQKWTVMSVNSVSRHFPLGNTPILA